MNPVNPSNNPNTNYFGFLRRLISQDFRNVSSDTLHDAASVLKALNLFFLHTLKPVDIYPSYHGSVILDWEFPSDKLISLEIADGKVSLYFEVKGKTKILHEMLSPETAVNELHEIRIDTYAA